MCLCVKNSNKRFSVFGIVLLTLYFGSLNTQFTPNFCKHVFSRFFLLSSFSYLPLFLIYFVCTAFRYFSGFLFASCIAVNCASEHHTPLLFANLVVLTFSTTLGSCMQLSKPFNDFSRNSLLAKPIPPYFSTCVCLILLIISGFLKLCA